MSQKVDFFKVRDIDTSIQPRKKKHQTNVSSALKKFEDHSRRLWDNRKNLDFAFPSHVSAGIPAETCSGGLKYEFFAIISEMPQVVLKRFSGRTNISLLFLFPWLDWGIDILDFEKIDFLGHERFWAFSAPWKRDFLTLEPILKGPLGGPRVKIFKFFFSEIIIFKKFLKFPKIYFGHPTTT